MLRTGIRANFKTCERKRLDDGGGRMDVLSCLRSLGLERYEPTFRENDVEKTIAHVLQPGREECWHHTETLRIKG
jgi:hypothetical protein